MQGCADSDTRVDWEVPFQGEPLPAGEPYALGGWRLRKAGTVAVWAKQGEAVT